MALIPELGGSPGGGNGNPLQYSCLENPVERSPLCCKVLDTPGRLSAYLGVSGSSFKC